ncbi:cGMP-dependent protein kinase, isozyme 1-like isoform X2 [Periplaneta americana]|uniref:cGMP-dependent protein kinase, isozyme 1-like isoform X2 n=1 Tax=Periplaneta americana TaxID=6978 RepID=UPI0037E85978
MKLKTFGIFNSKGTFDVTLKGTEDVKRKKKNTFDGSLVGRHKSLAETIAPLPQQRYPPEQIHSQRDSPKKYTYIGQDTAKKPDESQRDSPEKPVQTRRDLPEKPVQKRRDSFEKPVQRRCDSPEKKTQRRPNSAEKPVQTRRDLPEKPVHSLHVSAEKTVQERRDSLEKPVQGRRDSPEKKAQTRPNSAEKPVQSLLDSPEISIQSRHDSPEEQVNSLCESPEEQADSRCESPEEQVYSRRESPEEQVYSRRESPKEQFHNLRGLAEENVHNRRESPEEQVYIQRESPEEQVYSRRESPEEQVYNRRESPEEQVYSRRKSPEEQVYSRRESPEEQVYSRRESPEEQVYSRRESPEEQVYSRRESPEEQVYSRRESPEEQVYSRRESPEEQSHNLRDLPEENVHNRRESPEEQVHSQTGRKEEVSAEVPRFGVSSETSSASGIKTPVFEKDKESQELIRNAIMSNHFLKNLDRDRVQAIVEAMYMKGYEALQNVITEGAKGSHLYVSAEGKFEVYKGGNKVTSFGPGRTFGELAILYNTKRNATIRVVTNAKVWVLNRQVFQKIMMRTRLKDIEEKVKFLRSHPLLKDLSKEILAKMSDLLKVEFFSPGQCIIKQGDKGDKFYMISGGNVKISKLEPGDEKEQDMGTLSNGKYFGELALLIEDTRQATVTAIQPGAECLVLDRGPFIQLLGNIEEIKNNVDMYSNKKRESLERTIQHNANNEYSHIELQDLSIVGTLGVGGFGRVELVQYRKDKKLTFAMKCLKKHYVVEQQQEEHAYNEKDVMLACSGSPFITKLYRTYRDNKYVYFLMEACLGGDVFTALQEHKFFKEDTARFMTGCVVEALHYLHDRGFIYRDLKPENLLLDYKGYVKMTDFGFAKRVGHNGKTWTFAGTPEYVAPEIILNKGHDRAVDYWALGVFIHELVTGRWFEGFNWEALRKQEIKAPIIRPIQGPTDLRYFDKYPKDRNVPPDETSGWDKDF